MVLAEVARHVVNALLVCVVVGADIGGQEGMVTTLSETTNWRVGKPLFATLEEGVYVNAVVSSEKEAKALEEKLVKVKAAYDQVSTESSGTASAVLSGGSDAEVVQLKKENQRLTQALKEAKLNRGTTVDDAVSDSAEGNPGSPQFAHEPCTPPFCQFKCARQPAVLSEEMLKYPEPLVCPEGIFHPIVFGVPAENVVGCVPEKFDDFSPLIAGMSGTYAWGTSQESEYYRHYRNAMFGITRMKNGWDCYRHYEVLASGTVPYFLNLEHSPNATMRHLPKDLLLELRNMPGLPEIKNYRKLVNMRIPDVDKPDGQFLNTPKNGYMDELKIDRSKFDMEKYLDLSAKLLSYTQQRLTTKAIALYVLTMLKKTNPKKVLFLRPKKTPDYMQDLLMHGLYELLGNKVVEHPKAEHMYDFKASRGLVRDPKSLGMQARTAEAAKASGNGAAGVGFTFRFVPFSLNAFQIFYVYVLKTAE
jgi:hypothetical protein